MAIYFKENLFHKLCEYVYVSIFFKMFHTFLFYFLYATLQYFLTPFTWALLIPFDGTWDFVPMKISIDNYYVLFVYTTNYLTTLYFILEQLLNKFSYVLYVSYNYILYIYFFLFLLYFLLYIYRLYSLSIYLLLNFLRINLIRYSQ